MTPCRPGIPKEKFSEQTQLRQLSPRQREPTSCRKAVMSQVSTTYHVWIKPAGQVYDLFLKTIGQLSQLYRGPFFEPHITLLDSLPGTEEEISGRFSHLGASLQPFTIHLTESAYGDQYFQCVFLKVQKTPEIIHAHELAKGVFNKKSTVFMPHLSLLYGHYPSQLKEKIVAALPNTLLLHFSADRVELIRSRSEKPTDWISIMTLPLSG
jgi:2'-5' RNA ligase